jgi:two-component system, NarL family, nitrate/nitrite response regulator NarL
MERGRILITAKDSFSREGFKHLIFKDKFLVVGEESSFDGALSFLRSMQSPVDLIVCQLTDNQEAEIDTLATIGREFPDVITVVLVGGEISNELQYAIKEKVRGILPNTISSAGLNLVFQLLLCGENLAAIPAMLPGNPPPCSEAPSQAVYKTRVPLSQRENEILNCLKDGSPNKVIARKLDVAEATVKVHIKSLLRKIEVGNRTQAAVWAMNRSTSATTYVL